MQTFFKSLKCLCFKCRPDLHTEEFELDPDAELILDASRDLQRQIDRQILNNLIP